MNFQFSKEHLEGYCLSDSAVLRASLTTASSQITVEALDVYEPELAKKRGVVAAALSSTKTIVRPLELALVKSKDINSTFIFEAEALLPYPVEQCIIDKVRTHKTSSSTKLQVFAALKEDLESTLDLYRKHHIDPEILCPKQLALCHFAKYFLDKESAHLIIDIDASETTLVYSQNGLPLFCRALPYGLDRIQPQGGEKEGADPLPELHQFFREIARVLLSFQELQELRDLSLPLLFTGQVVENQALISLLSEFLKPPLATEWTIPPSIRLAKPYTYQEICRFATPLGTALSYLVLQKEMQSVNFRKDELAFTDKWLRWKKELVVYFSLIVLVGAAWLTIGKMQLEKGRKTLVVQYAQLLACIEKPPQRVEEEYAKSRGDDVPSHVDITSLSTEEIQDRLFFLEKEFTTTQEDLALHPDVPRVTDILAWLSTHPKVQGENGEGLKLENLHYLMVKRPEKGKMKERYSVRVELEFSSPNPTQAREFHDALLSPNPFVDAKSELKWSVQKDRYRASFILKDRTQYPHSIAQGELHAGN